MTRPVSPAVERSLAMARDAADYAIAMADGLRRHGAGNRDVAVLAVAVELLARDAGVTAYVAAELAMRLAEARPAEPVMPPAAAEIRLAQDFPDNQPLGGRHG